MFHLLLFCCSVVVYFSRSVAGLGLAGVAWQFVGVPKDSSDVCRAMCKTSRKIELCACGASFEPMEPLEPLKTLELPLPLEPALPRSQSPPITPPITRFGQSTNILLFAHKHIYRVWVWFSFRLFQVRTRTRKAEKWENCGEGEGEGVKGTTAPTGVLFHPFARQKLCKYVYHFHLPGALSARQTDDPPRCQDLVVLVSCVWLEFFPTHLSLNRRPRVLR